MRIESAEVSLADAAIMMCIISAANPTFGCACLLQAPPVLSQDIFKGHVAFYNQFSEKV